MLKNYLLLFSLVIFCQYALCQSSSKPFLVHASIDDSSSPLATVSPLDKISVIHANGKVISIKDGAGRIYYSGPVTNTITFTVSGALGKHIVSITDKKGNWTELSFDVSAQTSITGNQYYSDMFELFYKSMQTDTGSVKWNGKRYRFFVPWGLDHCHTMKGLKYFYDFGGEFVDIMRESQRDDGMIYSFVEHMPNMDYWRTRDAHTGYTQKVGDKYFVRQPTENHPEYIFVKTIYQWWKASGKDEWMKENLDAAAKALDYGMHDDARWSKRFQLLKRVYTIDSWDFQVEDEYMPDIGITNSMIIDPVRSKFGVFFGDNTGYFMACRELAEMYEHAGLTDKAKQFRQRGDQIENRLNDIAWNGKFYTHFIDEDTSVHRNLGVDEKSQLAQSNAYTLNRGISHHKSKAIIESYISLKNNLPIGSPGEWYSIYPPFERGFDRHGAKWQYMNGGVGGHVAGELARGAFENGFEAYGTDILERLFELGKKYDNKIYFSYTGSFPPPPPPPVYKPVNLSGVANMSTRIKKDNSALNWMNSNRSGDDFHNLPPGEQTFKGIRFDVIDPDKNKGRSVVAVSRQKGFPAQAEVKVKDKAGAIYFLHTSGKPSSENVSGSVAIVYQDGTRITRYMILEKQLTYWWFSRLNTDYSGIAWYGENDVSKGIGLSWCAIDNPHPDKVIDKIILQAAEDETIYTVFGITLSDRKHDVPVKGPSFGGPDNWAAATAMAAMIEGLAGVKDSPNTEAYETPLLSPRWNETNADTIHATIYYPASKAYVAYTYMNQKDKSEITLVATTSGKSINCHIMMPSGRQPKHVSADGIDISFSISTVENSTYADFKVDPLAAKKISIIY